ncbi:MAG: hypothetical protein Q8Q09_12305 [Deltaproteobacteria bacterium]|nr:hypothetical protein [Deltaproteobacteria bacterium]
MKPQEPTEAPLTIQQTDAPTDHRQWSARFGWFVGAMLGLTFGFLATYWVEKSVFASRGRDAIQAAARVSSVLVPACFLIGALVGHGLGGRANRSGYKFLGGAAGLAVLTAFWALLSLSR